MGLWESIGQGIQQSDKRYLTPYFPNRRFGP
jgi:hypothetical protein